MLLIMNLPVIHLTGGMLDWLSIQVPGRFFSFLFSIIFFTAIVFFNWFIFRKGQVKRIKLFINRKLLKTRLSVKVSLNLLPWVLLTWLIMFRVWNIDLVFEQRLHEITGVFGSAMKFGRNMIDESEINWGNAPIDEKNAEAVLNTDIWSDYGRFVRTYRWHKAIEKAENRYRIEKNLLAGLIMQESMGNPLELNSGDDGGAGLMMFQPGTAREYGLRTFGSSTATGRDNQHGKSLRRLVELKKYSYSDLSKIDERFSVEKSVNAGAKFLSVLYNRHQSWDKAISAYNRGKPAFFPSATKHVRLVRHFQGEYSGFLK
jgi:hypothetical protein